MTGTHICFSGVETGIEVRSLLNVSGDAYLSTKIMPQKNDVQKIGGNSARQVVHARLSWLPWLPLRPHPTYGPQPDCPRWNPSSMASALVRTGLVFGCETSIIVRKQKAKCSWDQSILHAVRMGVAANQSP